MARFQILRLLLAISVAASAVLHAQTPPDHTRCPVTLRPERAFIPPYPYLVRPPDPVAFWYGTSALWTQLWAPPPWTPWKAQQPVRMYWASASKADDAQPALVVTLNLLDSEGPTQQLVAAPEAIAYTPKRFGMIASVTFPSAGCWQVTGEYRGKKLKYVVQIEPAPIMSAMPAPLIARHKLSSLDWSVLATLRRSSLPAPVPPPPFSTGKRILNGHDCTSGDPYCEVISCGGNLAPCNDKQQKRIRENQQRRKDAFYKARVMLLQRGVPFDPDILLEPDWRSILQPVFDQMPEMKRMLRLSSLSGVVMADTLYVPAQVTTGTGPTVILVNHLVAEGCHPFFLGMSDIHFYPASARFLGMSLDRALQINHISRGQFAGREHLPPFSVIRELDLPPCSAKLTLDVSAGRVGPAPPALWPDPPAQPDYPK